MTNEYGSDSQPAPEHEPEHAAAQESHAHDVEGGVWPDDQPPHDDFGAVTEETATVSQETAAEIETDETSIAEPRYSRSMLPIFAGIGGILLLGILVYWQFGRSQPPSPPPAFINAMAAQKPTAAPSPPAADTSSVMPMPTNPAASSGAAPAVTPSPSAAPTTAMAPSPVNLPPAVIVSPQPEAAQVNPVPLMPDAVRLPNGSPQLPAATVSWGSDPQQLARINALTARIDDLQKSLDQENKQLGQVSNMVAAQVPPAPVVNQVNPDVENRLSKIEQILVKLESDEAAKASAPPVVETPRVVADNNYPRSIYSTKPVTVKHKHTHKKPKIVHHNRALLAREPTGEMGPASRPSSWVLRAATPREAWVSENPTSPELRHIQIGDTLPGVGAVRSIHETPSGWEIDGTGGVIR